MKTHGKDIGGFEYLFFHEVSQFNQSILRYAVHRFLWALCLEYPDFSTWYSSLYINNNLRKDREIIVCKYKDEVVGVSILKKHETENKICTLRVSRKFQHNGIGYQLIKRSIEWLEDDKPLITVRKSKAYQFNRLFTYFGFDLEESKARYYSFLSTENVYNGSLPSKTLVFNKLEIADIEQTIRWFLSRGITDIDLFVERFLQNWMKKEQIILEV